MNFVSTYLVSIACTSLPNVTFSRKVECCQIVASLIFKIFFRQLSILKLARKQSGADSCPGEKKKRHPYKIVRLTTGTAPPSSTLPRVGHFTADYSCTPHTFPLQQSLLGINQRWVTVSLYSQQNNDEARHSVVKGCVLLA